MILTLECVLYQHVDCAHAWEHRHLCRCPCHDLMPAVLESLEADGVDLDTCEDDVIERALVKVLEARYQEVLEGK